MTTDGIEARHAFPLPPALERRPCVRRNVRRLAVLALLTVALAFGAMLLR